MNKNLYIMYLIAFFQGLIFYGPVSLLFRVERGLTISEFFFLEFILLIITVIAEVPWGYFADKYGYKLTLIISYLIFFIGRLSLLFCHGFNGFLIQTVLTAIGVAGASGCDIAFIYDSCNKEESEKVFGNYTAIGKLSFFISSIASFFIISISMELAVIFTIVAYGISVVLILFTKDTCKFKDKEEHNISIMDCIKNTRKGSRIFLFILSMALITEICYGISINLGQLHFETIGLNIAYLGYISAFSELLGMLSCKTHVLSKKLGQYNALKLMMLMMLICVFILIFTDDLAVSIICVSGLSGLISIAYPIVLEIKNKSISKNRATMLSIYAMVGNILASFTNIIIGYCADMYLKYAFITCFVIMAIGVGGVYLYIEKVSNLDMEKC